MKYRVTKLSPEYKATTYSLAAIQISLLAALGLSYISASHFAFGYSVILLVGMISSHYRTERVDERHVTIPDS